MNYSSIFATLEKKEFMTFKKMAKMVDSPKSADFTLRKILEVRRPLVLVAMEQH